MHILYSPPYSPDFNPIELAFAAIKTKLHHHGTLIWNNMMEKDDSYVYKVLQDLVFSVTPEAAWGWFYKCGYV
ncbi:hypothetical protein M407DRAFT_72463 [Tulasnella calospora MUT 4182]|uniref:Tc1-like transposase DDE domain-containing protein n=1 Tax=Tulasnella calospora MUT 4182 TaxID=1051891 RepID=A0A0C3L2H0_9AGAM|nr:hypothetical protein M407DRAFT_72463 [Tulasnella calospora MUT 4182]